MFGHVESVDDRLEHLQRLRDTQDETGGFTAFICWTFQPENTRLKAETVTSAEYLRMQALSRIFLAISRICKLPGLLKARGSVRWR